MAQNLTAVHIGTPLNDGIRKENRSLLATKERRMARRESRQVLTPRPSIRRLDTPKSIRLVASARRVNCNTSEEPTFDGILKKQWKMYSVSPLYHLKFHNTFLKKYARSLDAALTQAQSSRINPMGSGSEKSNFSFYDDLRFTEDDLKPLRIQVVETNHGQGLKVVLEAVFLSIETTSPVSTDVESHFSYYPLVLVAGNKARTAVLFDWLERHFDCRSSQLTLSDTDLRELLTTCSGFMSDKTWPPVLLQYSLNSFCDGIDVINCNVEPHFCKEQWERLFASPETKYDLTTKDVHTYIDSIEQVLQHMMNINFKKLSLSEIGTSCAYISKHGKIKMFSPQVMYAVLKGLCDIASDKFMEIAL